MNGKKEFVLSLALLSVQNLGEDFLIKAIRAEQERGVINKKTASDLRNKLKEITQAKITSISRDNPIQELEAKVSQAVQNYR